MTEYQTKNKLSYIIQSSLTYNICLGKVTYLFIPLHQVNYIIPQLFIFIGQKDCTYTVHLKSQVLCKGVEILSFLASINSDLQQFRHVNVSMFHMHSKN